MNPRSARTLIGLTAIMAALSSVAPAFSNRVNPVRNQPGERLLPPPPRRERPIDYNKMAAAVNKRNRRQLRNANAMRVGGWVSTQAWLNRLDAVKLQ